MVRAPYSSAGEGRRTASPNTSSPSGRAPQARRNSATASISAASRVESYQGSPLQLPRGTQTTVS